MRSVAFVVALGLLAACGKGDENYGPETLKVAVDLRTLKYDPNQEVNFIPVTGAPASPILAEFNAEFGTYQATMEVRFEEAVDFVVSIENLTTGEVGYYPPIEFGATVSGYPICKVVSVSLPLGPNGEFVYFPASEFSTGWKTTFFDGGAASYPGVFTGC